MLAVVLPRGLLAMVLELNPQAPQCQLALVFVLAPEALVLMMLLSKKQVLLVPEQALVQVLPVTRRA